MSTISNGQQTNIYQNYFFPGKSVWVRFLVHKAGEYGADSHFFYRRVASVACAVIAVAFSFFNALSYLLQIPLKIPLNIVRYDPVSLVLDPVTDLSNCLRSLLFALYGVHFVAWGILSPSTAFPYFAPPVKKDPEKEIENLKREIEELKQQKT